MEEGPAQVPLKQLSRVTGLSPVLIRAWERRYGFPSEPRRTSGGHRRYSPTEVEMVRQAALLVRSGLRAAEAVERVRAGALPQRPTGAVTGLADLLLEPSATPAMEYLRAATIALGFETVFERLVVPALHEVGEQWRGGGASVADEHAATGIVMSWLGSLRSELPGDEADPVYVIANPEGEEHAVAVWALDVALRRRGVPVRALGASVPLADLVQESNRPSVAGVVLSISRRSMMRQVRRFAEAAAPGREKPLRVYVGGAGAAGALPPGVIQLPGMVTESADLLVAEKDRPRGQLLS